MALWKTPSNQWLWRLIHIYVDLLVDIIIIIIVALKIINIIRALHAVWLTLVCFELYVYTTELWNNYIICFSFKELHEMFVDMAMLVENQVSCKLNKSWHDQIVKKG